MVGTGPYRYVAWEPNQSLTLVRNDAYRGQRPAFARVAFRAITVTAARVAALLAGNVDLIENVPPTDLARLRQHARLAIAESISNRLIFLTLDSDRERSPTSTTSR